MRTSVVFVLGILLGSALAPVLAQGPRLAGENYVNHVAIAVENFDEAFAFYTQKMGFREAFTVRGADGKPTLAYVQANRNTFVELQPANGNGTLTTVSQSLRAACAGPERRGGRTEAARRDGR